MDRDFLYDRILGSLACACMGDAMGAPTEQRSIGEIQRLWGGRVERFYPPPEDSPYAKGRGAAQITDDASQMLHLVDAYLEGEGTLTPDSVAKALLRWSQSSQYFPRFAGPSTRAGIERLQNGEDPGNAGSVGRLTTEGTSNGAAMRVAPTGLMHPGDPEAAVRDALVTCLPTHGTDLAISGAACVAAAVATAMVPGNGLLDVIRAAQWGVAEGEQLGRKHGREVAGPSVRLRLNLALELAIKARDLDEAVADIAALVGSGLHVSEAVPAAVGIFVAANGDPFPAIVGGANAGDDTDTVACIAGSIAGAFRGFGRVPQHLYQEMLEANGLDLEGTAARFSSLVADKAGIR
jgi:ADP-ribosylglycohydrolase